VLRNRLANLQALYAQVAASLQATDELEARLAAVEHAFSKQRLRKRLWALGLSDDEAGGRLLARDAGDAAHAHDLAALQQLRDASHRRCPESTALQDDASLSDSFLDTPSPPPRVGRAASPAEVSPTQSEVAAALFVAGLPRPFSDSQESE